eukprot:CAMPEP_0183486654 /NCGR_PEP_ID=MMETSP0370-20130417/180044_1 /TAXON_ID=268820 /ORGANISM="Peridinium aciculiferum, Strain PAER-2" /LENGTH=868 /DNA_ID=CAMNT_0025679973 /DNA_START=77 /DNA_END=2680 /DNA_ORIENTATION=+
MAPKAKKAAAKKVEAPKVVEEEKKPEKRKAEEEKTEEAAAVEPPTKEAKVEPVTEKETDSVSDNRKAFTGEISFHVTDTTLNVIPTMGGKVLASLTDGGCQYLIAGARANVGMKAGRYMFETRILEVLPLPDAGGFGRKGAPASKATVRVGFSTAGSPLVLGDSEEHVFFDTALSDGGCQYLIAGARANVGIKAGRYMFETKILEVLPLPDAGGFGRKGAPASKAMVRVGFSTAGSPLVLGDSEEHVFFDTDGGCCMGKTRKPVCRKFFRDQTVGVLLNLDAKSENNNTISLFIDGVRACQPQALPEGLQGKTLFPHLAFRGVKVLMNWGPEPMKALPFKCRMLGTAPDADAVKAKAPEGKDGKYEVVLPVGFPDEGTFEWLDGFLEKRPQYTELSDRKILEWAASSGLWSGKGWKSSNDKPEFKFGAPGMDDGSIQKIINSVAGIMPRNYVVMEVKSNLVGADRQETLKRFSLPHFKKVAAVIMGTPPAEFKKVQQERILKDKQVKAETAWKMAKMEKKRAKDKVKQQKAFEERRKKMEEEAKKKAAEAEAKKAAEAESKTKAAAEKKEGDKEEEEKKEETKEEEKKEAEPMEVEEEEEEETEPPAVTLTDEEKKVNFAPKAIPDMTAAVMNKSFASFSVPEKAEGFDEVRYEWQKASECKAYLSKWMLEKKKTTRIEELKPGQWFNDTLKSFTEKFTAWQAKGKAWTESAEGKAKAEAKKKAEEKGLSASESKADGDIFSVEDVADIGSGEPLFKDFGLEDWALLNLRFELFTLQHAFAKDANDADRPGVPEQHLFFYYNRYFKKNVNLKGYGVDKLVDLALLVKDSITFEGDILSTPLDCEADDFNTLLKQTELARRERQRRLDA